MNSTTWKRLTFGTLSILILAIAAAPSYGFRHDESPCVANAETLGQIKAAQRATAKYHNLRVAEADGYTNINLPVPNMGEHWVNFDLVNDTFDPEKPEALVYADLGNGLELVAVEYLAPLSAEPPSGFAGTCDRWAPFGGALWTLHAWVWQPNLSGTFAKFNPMVP